MRFQGFRWAAVFALVCVLGVGAQAQEADDTAAITVEESQTIEFIRVEGTQRVEEETVRAYMVVQEGMADDVDLVDRSVKTLFGSGLFSDVTIRRSEGGLVVSVVENPIVNRVSFEGNSAINDDSLTKEGELQPRQVYTRARVQDDVERFIEIYRQSGYFASRIEPKVIQLPQNRVDVIFEINEGPVTGIRSINFLGNKAFDDDRLREEIITSETRWWRFFSSTDSYDPDRLNYDRQRLRRFYLSKGYADFRVINSSAELTRNGEEFFVVFNIDEGELFTFGPGKVSSTVESIDVESLQSAIVHEEGSKYDLRKIEDTEDALTKLLGEKGFAFADIRARTRRDREANLILVEYVIEEGPRVYIERININGNDRTQDEVLRREIRISEGDAFNRVLLERSRRNLRALGYFSSVEIEESPGSEEDKTIIDVNVVEQSTGELTFGVGYSSAESLTTEFAIAERNLLGKGQKLNLRVGVSSEVQRYSLSFTEPFFLDRRLAAGFSLFNTENDYDNEADLETRSTGVGAQVAFPLSEDGRLSLFINLSEDELLNTSTSSLVNPSYQDFKQELGYYFSIDKRDDAIDPTAGWNFGFGQDLAGPAGDITYLRSTMVANYYYEIAEGWLFHGRGTAGLIYDYDGGTVNYSDRFFKGGSSFRGFDRSGVGPRQISTGYSLGANRYVVATTEVSLPLGIPKDVGMKANAFIDFGFLGDTDSVSSVANDIEDEFAFRATTGLSISWRSPFGPVRFDFARALAKEDYDDTRFFRFSVGTRF
ncbi:MAG: Outer membrane protein assembly factor BamA [Rhodobiaceae bacterium UBA7378]|nr:MAG: Outer membrane protein assembly factor BamA [Rhodobiaceae bacterium UBA7378]